jgi:Ca-activated chloride channel family protein
MKPFVLHDPWWLLALAALFAVMWFRRHRTVAVLIVPFAAAWHRPSLAALSRWPAALAVLGLTLLIVGVARPQRVEDKREVRTQGYDIVLAIDLSGSMLAEDYERSGEAVNRLQAVKPVIQAFINDRTSDRIGIVVLRAAPTPAPRSRLTTNGSAAKSSGSRSA